MCGLASKAGPRPFLPQVTGTKPLSEIDWGSRPTPISTTLAAFDTVFEYLSMTRRGPALDADPHAKRFGSGHTYRSGGRLAFFFGRKRHQRSGRNRLARVWPYN